MKRTFSLSLAAALFLSLLTAMPLFATTDVVDALGRPFALEGPADRVLCSGSGALRLLTYLQAQHLIVGVEDIEKRTSARDARPYFLANRAAFSALPTIGEYRGRTRAELVLGLPEMPRVIFKTDPEAGTPAAGLQDATGIPVIPLDYGNLLDQRQALYASLRTMARVVGRQERAEAVIAFFETTLDDLRQRSASVVEAERPSCYVGGISFRGAHGLTATELGYPPFAFTGARAVTEAEAPSDRSAHAEISREKLLTWDPQHLFIDLSTLNSGERAGALYELKDNPSWDELKAVKGGRVYGLLPYNWYSQNFGSILADAYFVGKTLFPDRYTDVDPVAKADEIYLFLVGKALFEKMNEDFGGLVFQPLPLE